MAEEEGYEEYWERFKTRLAEADAKAGVCKLLPDILAAQASEVKSLMEAKDAKHASTEINRLIAYIKLSEACEELGE